MRNQSESSLGDVIRQLADEYNLKDKLNQVSVVRLWEEILGNMVGKNTKEIRFYDGTLRVRIESSALRQELEFQKNEIIAKLNDSLGQDVVRELVLC
ncbi:MAG: DciA family protein [Bacteroidota bacterium]